MSEACASCGTPLLVGSGFCEACGWQREPSTPVRWILEVSADPAWFEERRMSDIVFPECYPTRRFTLPRGESTIGRRSSRKRIEPDVDLGGAQEDPAVSRAHAVLVVGDDGSCSIVDLGSTNGTWMPGADEPIERGVPVKVADGTTFHIGAWTAITVYRDDD